MYTNSIQSQAWPASDGANHALSVKNWAHEAQPVAANGYWASRSFCHDWSMTGYAWSYEKEKWCQSYQQNGTGKENSTAECQRRKKRRRKPVSPKQVSCKPGSQACDADKSQAAEPEAKEAPSADHSSTILLPEHLALLAPFLSSNVDSGSWRATCRDAKQAVLPNGPYTAMLSPAGQAALVSLEKRKKLQKILISARKLVAGL